MIGRGEEKEGDEKAMDASEGEARESLRFSSANCVPGCGAASLGVDRGERRARGRWLFIKLGEDWEMSEEGWYELVSSVGVETELGSWG